VKLRIKLDDPETRAVWETVQRAKAEVAGWPAWKRLDGAVRSPPMPDQKPPPKPRCLNLIFDGPPSHDGPRLIEVEDDSGRSVRAGAWVERPDGTWVRLTPSDFVEPETT
jgi:hypothetical protein